MTRLKRLKHDKLSDMLKSIKDYHQKVLGLKFKGSFSPKAQEAKVIFYIDSNDQMLQKPMLNKILGLFPIAPLVITDRPLSTLNTHALFVFGDQNTPDTITYENLYSFQSLSNIAQNNDLKRSLWEKLKKYT